MLDFAEKNNREAFLLMKEKYKDKFVRIDYVVSYPIEKSLLYSIVYVCQGHSIWASLHP